MGENSTVDPKVDHTKVYLLVGVIALLLGLNAFLYFKSQQDANRTITVGGEQDRLRIEVQKIESELDKVGTLNVVLDSRLQEEQKLARNKIAQLKIDLENGKITQGDLDDASHQLKELKEFVKNYYEQVSRLEKQNVYLKNERDSLKSVATLYNARSHALRKQNQNLNEKVKKGAALKTSDIAIEAFRVKDNGKSYATTRASSANKFKVNFTIVKNDLAPRANHTAYLRVFDPAGNLIANDVNMFKANGQQMQYSSLVEFNYTNDETIYQIDWVNPKEFIEGTYTLILYADGFEMGKSSIELK